VKFLPILEENKIYKTEPIRKGFQIFKNMKMVINPTYHQLEFFIKNIPDRFEKEGRVIYNERNMLKVFTEQGYDIVVKRFRVPILLNKFAYSFLRKSKAERSYKYAFRLQEKGINTPDPIAYIENKKKGLIHFSYYICIFDKDSSSIRNQMLGKEGGEEFLNALAFFIAELHKKGILFLDLSPGNILYKIENGRPVFSLIDINRMTFLSKIPLKKRYINFKRLSERPTIVHYLAQEYAKICSLNIEEATKAIIKSSTAFFTKNHRKKKLATK
jgi:hypothetical protein